MSLIRVETDARGVMTLTLARVDKHNALSAQMMTELEEAARRLASDPSVRVVVLAAEGKTFCAGGDLAWMREQFDMDADTRRVESRRIATVLGALYDLPQPLIGRVQGNALGGGVGLVSVCDVAIGVTGAKFGFTETRLGLIPANIGPYVLARMGGTRASEVFMSARVFGAEEAVRLNLLSRTVDPDGLDAAIEAEVLPYLSCAPGAVAEAKALMRDLAGRVTPEQVDLAIDALARRWQSDEAREGVGAFFDKRGPSWQ
ncbi:MULTISPECIES: crotonase/enoyl-CoA hydratase family protein [Marivita]|uniref:Crotonase/enoyl-CoA hydratase family protein n=1 Tax=Marivita cryptomonadis TaxID=505252 RepID=A0A9Q2NYP4_9RHOB|nr:MULTISPECIES: crotonase/enoyl-CoA hydratase family protein [Marivita]MCR9169403.1 crotonase/enoyl-CoA hydratase family protein [Paracoccaceae bacterium]MBM2322385.1 crotonase/enoyl-CoA hydratase family protein [Marivita cryptomonadis]MBM2331967.1 crotonase/enoyl-CoA hydratase family protein [Marivita cryptomonadis]MBM2341551.1 crotonase/enoyl-CoA hydratase family protein [Marivita cryptomonadis]MBM2346215.1 crotonase/enoyl-CoA hydratase family protein [Marivita cryptomonadis]